LADEAHIEEVSCPLCGSADAVLYLRVWDRFDPARDRSWRIVRCHQCDLLYLNPRPVVAEASAYYASEEYDPFSGVKGDRSLWDRAYAVSRWFTLRWKRRIIERVVPGGRILAVGCGTGEFLHYMKRAGWQVAGVEPDARAAEFARHTMGLPVEAAGVEALDRMHEPWDVVTFWHVLEHLPDPLVALRSACRLLAPDGIVVVALPNPHSLDARFYVHRWVAWDAPRHLVHFTESTLSRAAEKAGLEIFECRAMPLDPAYNCLMSERYDPGVRFFVKWPRAAAIALASWVWGVWPFHSTARGSSTMFLLRHKRRGGQ
jgi:2-polyprenyl-3-methyl-5-hydroxy-6-metoxy-1,4-benzoquinol methylase